MIKEGIALEVACAATLIVEEFAKKTHVTDAHAKSAKELGEAWAAFYLSAIEKLD